MKIAGITAEYNPFHKGHHYHIEKTREALEADCIIAVMSGNFTQRGEAAVMDKWTRSRIATEEGVDLVVELPFLYACNRAEFFAQGAVDILQSMGVSHISFGSESGDLEALQALAEDMVRHRETLAEDRMHFMKKGFSFCKEPSAGVGADLWNGENEADGRAEQHSGFGISEADGVLERAGTSDESCDSQAVRIRIFREKRGERLCGSFCYPADDRARCSGDEELRSGVGSCKACCSSRSGCHGEGDVPAFAV